MDNAIYQLRLYESEIKMNNMMNRMSINKVYTYIDSKWDSDNAKLIKDMYDTIVKECLLDWFKNFTLYQDTYSMFLNNPELSKIFSNLKFTQNHTDISLANTLSAVKNVIENVR